MMYRYYNPAHMDAPKTHLESVRPVDLNDRFDAMRIRLRKPYATRTEAEQHPYGGRVYFYDGDTVYSAEVVQAWQYQPCTSVKCNPGINWTTYYAPSLKMLSDHLGRRYNETDAFAPKLNEYGLYEIQVHFDGRCR